MYKRGFIKLSGTFLLVVLIVFTLVFLTNSVSSASLSEEAKSRILEENVV